MRPSAKKWRAVLREPRHRISRRPDRPAFRAALFREETQGRRSIDRIDRRRSIRSVLASRRKKWRARERRLRPSRGKKKAGEGGEEGKSGLAVRCTARERCLVTKQGSPIKIPNDENKPDSSKNSGSAARFLPSPCRQPRSRTCARVRAHSARTHPGGLFVKVTLQRVPHRPTSHGLYLYPSNNNSNNPMIPTIIVISGIDARVNAFPMGGLLSPFNRERGTI